MQTSKVQAILFIFTLSAVLRAFKYEELAKIRSPCLAAFSEARITKTNTFSLLHKRTSLAFGPEHVVDFNDKRFLGEYVTAPLDRILDSLKLKNSNIEQEFQEFISYLDVQKDEIKSGKFDDLKAAIQWFLQRMVILSLSSEVSKKATVVNFGLDLAKIKAIASHIFEIFKESELAGNLEKWNELQLILSEKIAYFAKEIVPAANEYALFLANAEQYIRYELINMIVFPEKSTEFKIALEKFTALFNVYTEIVSNPSSIEVLAITALNHKQSQAQNLDSKYDSFIVDVVRLVFKKLSDNGLNKRAFRILRSFSKKQISPIQDSILSGLFSQIYKSSKNFAWNVDVPTAQKYWAFKAWDFVLHIRSDSEFVDEDVAFIVEHFDFMLDNQNLYHKTYEEYASLLIDFFVPAWTQTEYFKSVWLIGLNYRYEFSKDSSLTLSKFLTDAFNKNAHREAFKHIFLMKLANSLVNFANHNSVIEMPAISSEVIGEVKEGLSLPEMTLFDRIIRFLYIANHKKLSSEEIHNKTYIDWIAGRRFTADQFSWLRSSESKYVIERETKTVNKKLRLHFAKLLEQMDQKFVKPSVVKQVSGELLNDEFNFLTYADKIGQAMQSRPQIEFQDGLKTSFTYVQIVMRNSELYKSLSQEQ